MSKISFSLSVVFSCSALVMSALAQAMTAANETQVDAPALALVLSPGRSAGDCKDLNRQAAEFAARKDYKSAVPILQEALLKCANQRQILLDLARAQMLSEQFEPSLASVKKLLNDDPTNVEGLITQGQLEYLSGKDSEAESSLQQAIRSRPNVPEPHYWLGRLYYQQSRVQLAKSEFETVLQMDPKSYKAYDNLAVCFAAMGDDRKAFENYLKALDLAHEDHPEYADIYANVADLLIKTGDYRKGFDFAVEAVQRTPSSRNMLLAGKALQKLEKYDLSARWFERAIQIDPQYPEVHYALAYDYKKLGEKELAARELKAF